MHYIIAPSRLAFSSLKDVPPFVSRAIPYFFLLMMVE